MKIETIKNTDKMEHCLYRMADDVASSNFLRTISLSQLEIGGVLLQDLDRLFSHFYFKILTINFIRYVLFPS